ncbi:SNO glutamine amidotransferase [Paenibacillus vortex V453]|jgi:5'-phosphate synthase pdxT subunit|uniref:Pyridoxal 5'-phosphate synthase subunit PdxT n=2 Tax=Paenibacillus TaxID=44249 RepID=A0A163J0H1_9BACL|nr:MULTISPECIES: pyridoxal 5'-phosphate synthase glutaminase subunit PdxT [Paenibacillus]ANA80261.1 pyridoxal 5'-phosphate synthase subunit PdxT [Paenibacillus glucanolyticus]AVV55670.1 pyridoxal 5'-phosphate synthase glutaminase subunit PdxT [Paenibacillus glucanolyticus]EFU43459.1 SNO glutamine amidotransferase [Paenibacillus vortex V453]ETT33653.1 SNO glutamine amidotransferase [Paenibacillus sp. FSL R5-808]KZS46277.1 pyridoxal 5'-phosphate synthase subunit PdxT [Paenibacillus glucanolyticu
MKVGVLALQGAVAEHIRSISLAGAEGVPIKRREQLQDVDGLIIPGGESTTIGKLMRKYGFMDAITQFSTQGKPIFGTCAGLIVLAERIQGDEEAHLKLMDITVARNAFGRQRESFETDLDVKGIDEKVRAVFIRAPLILEVGAGVEVLSTYKDEIVTARQRHLLAASYHPELTDDYRLHQYFVEMVRSQSAAAQK